VIYYNQGKGIRPKEREENKMLVRVWNGFVLKGYTKKEKGVFKKRLVREEIYVATGITPFVCDESEIEEKLTEAIEKKMKTTPGWGIDFEGWTEICKDRKTLAKKYPYEEEYWLDCMTSEEPASIEYISEYPMEKILKVLNGQQFAQFCKENNLSEIILK
jgi:hypothetical protein